MAFVSLGTSSVLGQKLRNVNQAVDQKPVFGSTPTMTMYTFVAPRSSFSSIDMPERASVLYDENFETKEALLNAAYKHVFGNCTNEIASTTNL